MATDFKSFLKQNAIQPESVKFAVSKRFVDGKGNPLEWEICPVTSKQDERIRKDCTREVPIPGKRGQKDLKVDTDAYLLKLCTSCIISPNLNEVELQDSYGAKDAGELLQSMLLAGEYTDLKNKVVEVNGFDVGFEELEEEAKN